MTPRYSWGARSIRKMETCHSDLVTVLETSLSLSPFDITVVCGARTEEQQEDAFRAGNSKVRWPDSAHNCPDPGQLSMAVDIAPWIDGKINWSDEGSFYCLAGVMLAASNLTGVRLAYGGDWDHDGLTEDQTFMDLGHFYLLT